MGRTAAMNQRTGKGLSWFWAFELQVQGFAVRTQSLGVRISLGVVVGTYGLNLRFGLEGLMETKRSKRYDEFRD